MPRLRPASRGVFARDDAFFQLSRHALIGQNRFSVISSLKAPRPPFNARVHRQFFTHARRSNSRLDPNQKELDARLLDAALHYSRS
jgi:hypothetical protein